MFYFRCWQLILVQPLSFVPLFITVPVVAEWRTSSWGAMVAALCVKNLLALA